MSIKMAFIGNHENKDVYADVDDNHENNDVTEDTENKAVHAEDVDDDHDNNDVTEADDDDDDEKEHDDLCGGKRKILRAIRPGFKGHLPFGGKKPRITNPRPWIAPNDKKEPVVDDKGL